MKAERCRDLQGSLGAYALGNLPEEERPGLESHLEGCPACRAELEALSSVAGLLPLVDPTRLESAPTPDPSLRKRILAEIGRERRSRRRRRFSVGLSLGTAAAAAATVLALVLLPGGGEPPPPEKHVEFASLPRNLKISAKLIPHSFGTEVHVYVKGAPSGALCRVFLRARNGARLSAGSFRYRWGDDSLAILSSALDLSRTEAIGVRVGERTFVAPVPLGTQSALAQPIGAT
jgi:anti-sigma factor RsiW